MSRFSYSTGFQSADHLIAEGLGCHITLTLCIGTRSRGEVIVKLTGAKARAAEVLLMFDGVADFEPHEFRLFGASLGDKATALLKNPANAIPHYQPMILKSDRASVFELLHQFGGHDAAKGSIGKAGMVMLCIISPRATIGRVLSILSGLSHQRNRKERRGRSAEALPELSSWRQYTNRAVDFLGMNTRHG